MRNNDAFLVGDPFFKIVHNDLQRLAASLGDLFHLDRAFLTGYADAPESQMSQDDPRDFGHSSVIDQIVIGRKGKDQLMIRHKLMDLRLDLLKSQALCDQLLQFVDGHGKAGARSAGIQDLDISKRIILQNHLLGGTGAVIAAGEIGGNGDGKHIIFFPEFPDPVRRRGTGSMALLTYGHRLYQFADIQLFIIHKIPAVYCDHERNGVEIHIGGLIIQVENITA